MSPALKRRWAVIGASGFVGSAVHRRLKRQAADVTAIKAPRLLCFDDDVDELLGTGRRSAAVTPLVEQLTDIDVVVNAAGPATPDALASPALTGAHALLPVVIALAAAQAGVRRVVHLSSAAVQGRQPVLSEDRSVAPFSPYSRAKALGEQAMFALEGTTDVVALRATSVQGSGRATTARLQRLAQSALSSVAGDGGQPSAASSITSLAELVIHVGSWHGPVPSVVLQPWEGLSAADVLRAVGGREPFHLPAALCRAVVGVGYAGTSVVGGRGRGLVRRVESMWFGQAVQASWAHENGFQSISCLRDVLKVGGS